MTGAHRNPAVGWRFLALVSVVMLIATGAICLCTGQWEPLIGGIVAMLLFAAVLAFFAWADRP